MLTIVGVATAVGKTIAKSSILGNKLNNSLELLSIK